MRGLPGWLLEPLEIPDIDGQAGLSVNDQGEPVILVQTCSIEVDDIDFSGPNTDGRNESYGAWDKDDPVSGLIELNPRDLPEGWRQSDPFRPPGGDDGRVILTAGRKDAEVAQAAVDFNVIKKLSPGRVLIDDPDDDPGNPNWKGKEISLDEFNQCENTN